MIPFNSLLERAQAYEINQLRAELAYYRRREESSRIKPVWQPAETLGLEKLSTTINTLSLVGEACAALGEDGVHVKGRTKGGLHVGYYLSRAELATARDIQALILDELMQDVSRELSGLLMVGELDDQARTK